MSDAIAITRCRGCGGADLVKVLDLGLQSACDHFPPADSHAVDPRWPLGLVWCRDCTLCQLTHSSPVAEAPLAVESATMQQHAREVSERVVQATGLRPGALAVEFSSEHGGSWHDGLAAAGLELRPEGPADLVIDNHSLIHDEDLSAAVARRAAALRTDGWLAIEFHHALSQVEQAQFDTVRHGHPVYLSLHAWRAVCAEHGLAVVDAWDEPVYGGCLVVLARPGLHEPGPRVARILAAEERAGLVDGSAYARFAARAAAMITGVRDHLTEAAEEGLTVIGYGAGSKTCTLLGAAEVGPQLLSAVADLSPAKNGRRIPGVGVPIISAEDLVRAEPDEVFIMAWDIASEVVEQLRGAGLRDTRYVVSMPTIHEID